ECIDAHVLIPGGQQLNHLLALFHRKQWSLLRIAQDGHHQLIENAAAARDQVQMPLGWRIERSGINGHLARQKPSLGTSGMWLPSDSKAQSTLRQCGFPRNLRFSPQSTPEENYASMCQKPQKSFMLTH